MKKAIHILFIPWLLLLSSVTVRADSPPNSFLFNRTDSLPANYFNDSTNTAQKICSCQLMNVEDGKFGSELVGIFAEKTLDGKQLNNFKLMDGFIRREKLYFSIVFVRSVERKERFRVQTDCMSLYSKLKKENKDLKMYNILDIDILAPLAVR